MFKTYLVKLRIKEETWGDSEARIKTSVVGVTELDYVSECEQMYVELQKYAALQGQAHTR